MSGPPLHLHGCFPDYFCNCVGNGEQRYRRLAALLQCARVDASRRVASPGRRCPSGGNNSSPKARSAAIYGRAVLAGAPVGASEGEAQIEHSLGIDALVRHRLELKAPAFQL